ncbi:hypothetical protein Tco_0123307 [Tanacetum coccineum]
MLRGTKTNAFEIPLDFEEDVFDDEVQQNEAIPLSDKEIALDASSEGTLSPGGPRGQSGTLVGQGSVTIVSADADYLPSYNKGWMPFIKRSDAAPVCYSKPLDSVKNWNDHFFWVDSTVFPFSVSLKRALSTHPPKRLREDFHAATSDIGGKSLAALGGLIPKDSSVYSIVDVPVVTAVVTTTIVADVSVVLPPQFRFVSGRYASVGEDKKNVSSTSKLDEPTTSSDSFYAAQDLNSETLHNIYIFLNGKLQMTLCSTIPRQMCLGVEVRMRAKHTLEQKNRLEDKCFEQSARLLEKDTEISHLRSLLSLKESEAAEAIRLHAQVSIVEAVDAFKGSHFSCDELNSKVVSLESKIGGLVNQISLLESAFELFKQQMEAMQDEQATALRNRVMELDAQLLEMAAHLEEEFYPRFLVTIFGRRWILTHGLKLVHIKCLQSSKYCHDLGQAIGCAINKGIQDGLKAGVDHGKARRDLFVIEAYDPSAESKYIDAVNALGAVDFTLLTELESKKDTCNIPGTTLLPIHRTEDNVLLEETSLSFSLQVIHSQVQRVKGEIKEKRLSLTDVMVPLVEPLSSKRLIGEASTSTAPATADPITILSMTFALSGVVPPLSVPDYQVLDTELHDVDPSSTA